MLVDIRTARASVRSCAWQMILLPVLLILTLAAPKPVHAQPRAEITAYQQKMEVGDQLEFFLKLRQEHEDVQVVWPEVAQHVSGLEVTKLSGIDTQRTEQGLLLTQAVTVMAWDSGTFRLGPFPFHYFQPPDTTQRTFLTDSLLLQVSMLPIDTTAAIRPIEEPLEVPYTWREILPYALIGLAALLLIAGIFFFLKRRKRQAAGPAPAGPPPLPHEWALEQLDQLYHEKPWQEGEIKSFYVRLSTILRTYIERRYHVQALEQTTGELAATMQEQGSGAWTGEVEAVLRQADAVKFAKAKPGSAECQEHLDLSREYVAFTAPKEAENEENETEA